MKTRTLLAVLLAAGIPAVAFAHPFGADGYGTTGVQGCRMAGFQGAEIESVSGTVSDIGLHETELSGGDLHIPYWFAEEIGLKKGDFVTAAGVYAYMHDELVPFEMAVNGKTYGSSENRIPVWRQ
jgi:hypothetical protein